LKEALKKLQGFAETIPWAISAGLIFGSRRALVEGHQLFEDLQIFLGVISLGQQAAKHDCPHKFQRLAALPVATQCRQGLACACLALTLSFERDLLRRKHRLDQRWCVPQGKGL
jgi:hypothetical protein